jgi:phosphatidylglycerophosphatase A
VRHLERLPGGWGIVADDVAAALYAAAAVRLIWAALS